MPAHDWTRVEAGIFHGFHIGWIAELGKTLNGGLLPEGFYALAEQHAGRSIADVLTLHAGPASLEPLPLPPLTGGTAVAEAPPNVRTDRPGPPAELGHSPRQRPSPRGACGDLISGQQGSPSDRRGIQCQGGGRAGRRRAFAAGGPVAARPLRPAGDARPGAPTSGTVR